MCQKEFGDGLPHVYFQVFNEIRSIDDFNKQELQNEEKVRVVIFIDDFLIDQMGEELEVETRVKNYNCNLPFESKAKDLFYRFNSRQHQYIVTQLLRRELDIDRLMANKVLLEHFPLHSPERLNIIVSWKEYRLRLWRGFVLGNFMENMQPLNVIKDYYGEKMAFYFSWLMHYTGWLMALSVFSLVFCIITLERGISNDIKLDQMFNTPYSFIYGVVVLIWVTLFHESWKRKQNRIANEWLVRNF